MAKRALLSAGLLLLGAVLGFFPVGTGLGEQLYRVVDPARHSRNYGLLQVLDGLEHVAYVLGGGVVGALLGAGLLGVGSALWHTRAAPRERNASG